jgi:RHS repeat-associated protein
MVSTLRLSTPLVVGFLYGFEYDGSGQLIAIVDGDGNTTTIERSPDGLAEAIVSPDGQRTELSLNEWGRLEVVTDPEGHQWLVDYTSSGLLAEFTDRGGFSTEYIYNDLGEFSGSVDQLGGGWTTHGQSDSSHIETHMETAEGHVYGFLAERLTTGAREHTRIEPSGLQLSRKITPAQGRTEVSFPDGTQYVRMDGPDPRFGLTSPIADRQSTMLPSGLVQEVETSRVASLEDPADVFSLMELTHETTVNERKTVATFDGGTLEWTLQSPTGREATVRIDEQGRPLHATQADLAPVTYAYDDRGRPKSIVTSDGESDRTVSFEYHTEGHQAGFLASLTDPLERTTNFEYDAVGRVTRQTYPDNRFVDFTYDPEGNLRTLTPPGRSAHVFEYTGPGDRERYDPPELPGIDVVTIYRYNLDRQLTEIERPGGEIVVFDYDTGGRLDSITSDAGVVDYGYHPDTGQLSTIDTSDGVELTYTWDGFLPVSETWQGEVNGTVTRGYDNNFWLTTETAAGHVVTYDYDDDGLLTDAGPLELIRDVDNGLVNGTSMADIIGSQGYNAFGELMAREVEIDEIPVYQAGYTRDLLGRIEEQTLVIDGFSDTWTYHYDDAGRLEMVERDGVTEYVYVYDDNGNRKEHSGPGGTVTADHDEQDRLLQYGDITYTRTDAGERLTRTDAAGTTHYDYDATSNLREVTLPDGTTIEYLIDGRDRRVGKKVNGELQKTWIYRDQLSPVAQFDGEGNLTHRFVYAEMAHSPSWMVRIDPVTEEEFIYRIITDHLGSIRLVIEVETGIVAQRMDYGPFGEVLFDSNPGFQPFGFAGGIYDRDTELVRFGARDYDPEIGRWAAKDPIDFGGGDTNLFGYTLSDPVNLIDPNGQQHEFPGDPGYGQRTRIPDNPDNYSDETILDWQFRKAMRELGCIAGCLPPAIVAEGAGQVFQGLIQRKSELLGAGVRQCVRGLTRGIGVVSSYTTVAGYSRCIQECAGVL